MDMIKCPQCGELYSSSYRRCPFCEEDGDDSRLISYKPRRRIAARQQAQSARGGLIVVLLLVLALLSWYLFGDNFLRRGEKPSASDVDEPATRQDEPAVPASKPNDDPFFEPQSGGEPSGAGQEPQGGAAEPAGEPAQIAAPVENVDVSGAKLNRDDFTLGYAGEKFTIKLSGTEATPRWSIENANVASLSADGTVTALANGNTTVHCAVGTRDLTCVVRVRNTGKTAAEADAPTVAEPIVPTEPPAPGTSSTPAASAETKPAASTPAEPAPSAPASTAHVDVSSLSVRTNYGTKLSKDPDTGMPDCTVRIGGDPIALRVEGTDVAVSSWTSDKPSVVGIDASGRLTPVSAGTAHVSATVGDATVTCIIRVRPSA